MCTYSFVGDHYNDKWKPYIQPQTWPGTGTTPVQPNITINPGVTREELEALRAEVEEMRELLLIAKDLDRRLGTPDCENIDKIAVMRAVAEAVKQALGLDIDLEECFS